MHRWAHRLHVTAAVLVAVVLVLMTALVVLPAQAAASGGAVLTDPGCSARTSDDASPSSNGFVPAWDIGIYGETHRGIYVSPDGGVALGGPEAVRSLIGTQRPVIGAMLTDLVTQSPASQVTFGPISFDGHQALCVNWVGVGVASSEDAALRNSAQLVVVDRNETGPGNVDVYFNYDGIQYDDGIQVGFAGGGASFDLLQYPGSGSGFYTDGYGTALATGSTPGQVAGRHLVEVRGGRPLLPGQQAISLTVPDSLAPGGTGAVSATASSGLPVTIGVTGPCSLDGTSLVGLSAGTCEVTANQPGDAAYASAAPVVKQVAVGRRLVSIALEGLTASYDGSPHSVTATASNGAPPVITYDGSPLPPTARGSYAVRAVVDGPQDAGEATGTLVITGQQRDIGVYLPDEIANGSGWYFLGGADRLLPQTTVTGPCVLEQGELPVLRPQHAGTCVLTVTMAGDESHEPFHATRSITVVKGAVPYVTLYNLQQTYSGTPLAVAVSSFPDQLPGLHLTYDGSPEVPTSVGSYTVQLTMDDNPDFYLGTPVEATLTIGPGSQYVAVYPGYSGAPVGTQVPLHVYSSNDSPPVLSVSGPCTLVEGSSVRLEHVGQCLVTASQPATSQYSAAEPMTQVIDVWARSQEILLSPLPSVTVGDAPLVPEVTTTSGLPVALSADGACVLVDGRLTFPHAGPCTLTADQPGDADTTPALTRQVWTYVQQGAQSVSVSASAKLRLGDAVQVESSSSAGLPVSLAVVQGPCTLTGTALSSIAAGTCVVEATAGGDADHRAASPAYATVDVFDPAQTVRLDPLPDVRWGESPAGVVTEATSGLAVDVVAAGACSYAPAGLVLVDLGTCTVTSTQPGDATFDPASATRSFQVLPGLASVAQADLLQTEGSVHPIGVTTTPDGLATTTTFDGSPELPTRPGRYLVRTTISDPHYEPAFLESALEVVPRSVEPPPDPTPTLDPTPTADPSPTAEPTTTPDRTPSAPPEPTVSPTPSVTPEPAVSPTPKPAAPATSSPTVAPSVTPTSGATASPTASRTPPSTATPRPTATPVPTPVVTRSPAPPSSPRPAPEALAPVSTATLPAPAVTTQAPVQVVTPSATPASTPSTPSSSPVPTDPAAESAAPSAEAQLQDPVVDPASGERPAPAPGRSLALLDGEPAVATVTSSDTGVRVATGSLTLEVAALGADGAVHRPGERSTLTLDRGGNLRLQASGYEPGSEVVAWVFSTPMRLGSTSASASGTVSAVFPVPTSLAGGNHTLQVNGTTAQGLRSVSLGLRIDASGVPLWQAVDHPEVVAATQVALFALTGVAALGGLGASVGALSTGTVGGGAAGAAGAVGGRAAGSGGASGGSSGGDEPDEDEQRKGGKVAAAKVKHLDGGTGAQALGDRSPTWRARGTVAVDTASLTWPVRVGPLSPLLARLMTDAVYLRAMLGALAALVPLAAGAAGGMAGLGGGALAAPTAAVVSIVLVLGTMDALAGLVAAACFLTTVGLTGGLDSADAVRGSLGVAALWFALPLIVGETRPLRREAAKTAAAAWYRAGDLVVLPLLATWLTFKLVKAFPGLYGHAVPISASAGEIAVVAGLAVLARLLVEETASRLYPERLKAVTPGKIPPPPTWQKVSAVAVRTSLFVFVAVPFVGMRPELLIGAALFLVPQLGKVWDSKLPNLPWLHRLLPSGLVKLTGLVVVGWWLASQLGDRVEDPSRLAALGFVVLAIPPFVQGSLGLLGRESPKPAPTWLRRGLGALVVVVSVQLVYSLTAA